MKNFYKIPLKTITGETTTLEAYQGKLLLIINVASRCGFTKQYHEIEQLYRDYHKKGLEVLGFPCNQFLNQEPGDNKTIQDYATSCFSVTFPLFEKIDVKGPHQSPLYTYLKEHIEKKPLIFVPWNFTKILVTEDGRVMQQFLPITALKQIRKIIDNRLNSSV